MNRAPMRILVTGITGYVGGALAPRLLRDGHDLRGLARNPDRCMIDVPLVRGDVLSGEGLDEALDGVDVAYYLIHSMEGAAGGAFPEQERRGSERFAAAAAKCSAERRSFSSKARSRPSIEWMR